MENVIKTLAKIDKPTQIAGNDSNLDVKVIDILNAIIIVLSIVCVAVIIIGGVQYMTSSGDAGKVKKAKDTILYAIIGLVVCALAATIVNFVIANILKGV
ncbi:hypothetical protein IKF12_03350 [Candidatus Saccharibacteria bacterium]|nr:hypothetical protein [Candidatus Saccharibacteria bacterium]